MNILNFPERKRNHDRIVMVTCYDYSMARIVAESDIDMILVGDSAAMVVEQLMDVATSEGTEYIVMSLSGSVEETLSALGIIQRVPEAHIVNTLDEAREVAREMLGM